MRSARGLLVGAALVGAVGGALSIDVPAGIAHAHGTQAAILALIAGGIGASFGGTRNLLSEQTPIVGGLLAHFALGLFLAFVPLTHLTVWSLAASTLVGLFQNTILGPAPMQRPTWIWRVVPAVVAGCLLTRGVRFFATLPL
jgi:hypothetical protein